MTRVTAMGAGSPPSWPRRVLLVEDSELDLQLTLDAFGEVLPQTRVDTARSGEEALEQLGQEIEAGGELPDLVLLDLKLPGIPGSEVLREVRAEARTRRVPVVIFSSSREESDRAECYDSGANGYLVKPRNWDGFLGVVRSAGEFWLQWNAPPPWVPPGDVAPSRWARDDGGAP